VAAVQTEAAEPSRVLSDASRKQLNAVSGHLLSCTARNAETFRSADRRFIITIINLISKPPLTI